MKVKYLLVITWIFFLTVDGSAQKIMRLVSSQPEFPGGNAALANWIQENLKPDSTLKEPVTIKTIFTIDTEGLPTSIALEGDTLNGRGKKIIELFKKMPAWEPGRQNSARVKTRLALSIVFPIIEASNSKEQKKGKSKRTNKK